MLCTGCMPRWVGEVVEGCPFLFPLEARELYTAVTAFGVSRALHAMQRLHPNASHSPAGDVRIGRIQREKIRVGPRERVDGEGSMAMLAHCHAAHCRAAPWRAHSGGGGVRPARHGLQRCTSPWPLQAPPRLCCPLRGGNAALRCLVALRGPRRRRRGVARGVHRGVVLCRMLPWGRRAAGR
jgi:hypothetical protein